MQNSLSPRLPSTYVLRMSKNGEHVANSDGLEFHDEESIWRDAGMSCVEIIRGRGIDPGSNWQMEVSDDTGKTVYRFTFTAEAL